MNKQQPIGVIDSGVGGLTVLRRLQELMPHEHFIFLGDTLNTPYGNRSREDIIRLVNQMTDYLSYRNIKLWLRRAIRLRSWEKKPSATAMILKSSAWPRAAR